MPHYPKYLVAVLEYNSFLVILEFVESDITKVPKHITTNPKELIDFQRRQSVPKNKRAITDYGSGSFRISSYKK